jgi:hypothetical protein
MPLTRSRAFVAPALVWGVAILAMSAAPKAQDGFAARLGLDFGPSDETLRQLFTPASLPPGTFEVHRSPEDIRGLASRLRARSAAPVNGMWRVDHAGVFDAFGAEGPYNKPKLARLFGGSSPLVARGTLPTSNGRYAVTLISPYPDSTLSALEPGTLVIVTKLPVP